MLATFGMVAVGSRASADSTYYIDPSQSYLTVGVYLGDPLKGGNLGTASQTGTSDTTWLYGNLQAAIGGGNISFGGGSVGLAYQTTNMLPDANGGDSAGPDPAGTGGAPAQFGLVLLPNGLGLSGYLSVYNAAATVTDFAGPTALTPGPGVGIFDATQQDVGLTSAGISYWLNGVAAGLGILYGSEVVAPPTASVQNNVSSGGYSTYAQGVVTSLGGVTSILLPVFADVEQVVSGITLDVLLSGQIVATSVPEPSTFVLAGVGLVGSLVVVSARRRLRKA
jgi:hypothetical protein